MEYFNKDLTITAAIIVKNEERCIFRCLKSLLPLFYEIIVIDTGSEDETISIIQSFKSDKIKLFEIGWDDDFSKPRNVAIEKTIGKYIFFIDADEYITSTKTEFDVELSRIKTISHGEFFAWSPYIKDHNNDTSCSIRRLFFNDGGYYYFGFVHEELRRNDNKKIKDSSIGISISHDGYAYDIIKNKNKLERNNKLNLKNLDKEPHYLRWNYFYFRDDFERIPPNKVYNDLCKLIKINAALDISFKNIINDTYTFPIIDLMARSKLKSLDDDAIFFNLISIMDSIIPGNTNGIYYSFLYDIFIWKRKASNNLRKVIECKKKGNLYNYGMLHSGGLHIDAILSFYLYEVGMYKQSRRLLQSVKDSGFQTELVERYLSYPL